MSRLEDLIGKELRKSLKQIGDDTKKCLRPYEEHIHELERDLKAKKAYEAAYPGWAKFNDAVNPLYSNSREVKQELDDAKMAYGDAVITCGVKSLKNSNSR